MVVGAGRELHIFSWASRISPVFLCLALSIFFLFFIFIQLYCPNGISPMRNSGCFPREKPAATESRYPTYGACWVFWCFHNSPNSDMDYRIFNVRTYVNACDCTRGCTDTRKRVCTESGRKIPCHIGESNLRRRRGGPMLYQ